MRDPRPAGLMPHEAAFTAFFLLTWARLAGAAGWAAPATLRYAGLAAAVPLAAAALGWAGRRWGGPWVLRARLFAFLPLMCAVFRDLRGTVPLVHPGHVDALLQGLDLRLLGAELPRLLDGLLSGGPGGIATEALSLCYLLFFPLLLLASVRWLFAPAWQGRAFYGGLFTLYAVGFAGYTALPALGPYATMEFATPLGGHGLTRLLLQTVPWGTNRADAFPSLHCAVSAFILGFEVLAGSRRLAASAALPVAGLWASTILLRFHYATDVLAGFALAGLCLALAAALLRPTRSRALPFTPSARRAAPRAIQEH